MHATIGKEWNCTLERLANASLNEKCTKNAPEAPQGTTGFFDYITEGELLVAGKPRPFGMELWLSEIERTSMDVDTTLRFVLYENLNENYSNLVRYNAYGIGCAGKFCTDAKDQFNIFCLTNKPRDTSSKQLTVITIGALIATAEYAQIPMKCSILQEEFLR
ncbi:hypothetical protein ANCCAN_08060 [Ancylostoma caninum]|uniref:SCP domain-containing protein n=1 Tax=Ancylostoma caninum TaxID=29170 RepID=A0A368GSD2_ANCCA|nr:hypothetical protein ANCCAN_08060 [Ancylostoma caninum]